MKNFYKIKARQIIIGICLLGLIGFTNIYAQEDWDPIAPPGSPDARQGQSMVTLPDGRVFLFGGEDVEGTLLNDTYAFDTNGWKEMIPNNSPPPKRKFHQAWTRADLMYIYGGEGENGALGDLWIYNPATNTWHQEVISGPRPAARHGHSTTTLTDGSEVIVCGTGTDGSGLKDCWKLNTDNTFTQLQDAPYAYTGHCTELSPNGEWLYVFGKPGSIGIYRVTTDRWTTVGGGPPNGKGCMTSRGNNSAGEPVIFIFGGKDVNGNEMNQTWQFNLYSGELTQRGNMPQPIVNGSVAEIRATPPAAGLLKGTNLNFLEDYGQTTLVFGGVSNGEVTNNEYLFSAQTPPDTIITIARADTIKTDTVRLLWNIAAPIGASYYEVQVLLDTTNTVFVDTVLTDTTVTITGLQGQKYYYWRVRGFNSGGWGPESELKSFFTDFPVGVDDEGRDIVNNFKLYQNYPNPFNPSTTIQFSLPETEMVNLKVFNVIGEEVAELINKEMDAGYQSIVFDASNLPSGLYIYRLQAGDFVDVKKMTLIK